MFFSKILLLACTVEWSLSVKIELYSEKDFTGLLEAKSLDANVEKECTSLARHYDVKSIKTDKCVMLYETADCTHRNTTEFPLIPYYSVRVDKTTSRFEIDTALYFKNGDHRGVQSFHVCSQELGGGPKLDVDFYERLDFLTDILISWKGVCKCTNVPSRISFVDSIDNHGNSMYVFSGQHCQGFKKFIPAGDNDISREVFDGFIKGEVFDIKSFRPADTVNCIQLSASIDKFTFFNGSHLGGYKEVDIQLAPTQTMVNNGLQPITRTVDYSKRINSMVEYTVADAFTKVHSVGLKADFIPDSRVGVLLLDQSAFKESIEHNFARTDETTDTEPITVSESETLTVTADIVVNPREKCDVSGFVKVLENFPIINNARTFVQGDDASLTAAEIRVYLPPGMEYVNDFDDYTVLATVEETMRADFVWKTFISKKCEALPGSRASAGLNREREEIYEVPFGLVGRDPPKPSPRGGA